MRGFVARVLPHKICGHVQDDWATLCLCTIDRAGQIMGCGFRRTHLLKAGTADGRDATLIDILQMLWVRCGRITGEQHHLRLRADSISQSRHTIGQRRPVGDRCNADFAGRMGIALRHEHGTAFINDGNVGAFRLARVGIDQKEVGVTDQAKHRLDAVVCQPTCQRLINLDGVSCHDCLLRREVCHART